MYICNCYLAMKANQRHEVLVLQLRSIHQVCMYVCMYVCTYVLRGAPLVPSTVAVIVSA